MKKILSALISATVILNAVPLVSVAEETTETSDEMPYTVDDNSVIFEGGNDFDYIISTNLPFSTERNDNSTTFTPEQDGKYIVSRVWLEESIINYDTTVTIDDEETEMNTHCHYFYPHIQNFEITYNKNTGTQVEFSGEHRYYNESTVNEKIKTNPSMACYDYMEMSTEDILDRSAYYAFVSSHLLRDTGAFLTYYDYGWNDEKDKSIYCIDYGYNANETGKINVNVSGNAEILKTVYGGSYIDGNFEFATCDMVPYILIEPTADGYAEVYASALNPMGSTVLTIENGQFKPERFTQGCVLETGDLNYDYEMNIADAVIFQKYLLGQTDLTSTQYTCADLNYDGHVDVFDMVTFRQEVINN
ncbi:MAG: dockerin type I repeat-containing protein [Ruminococcus sp.]|nr:dockerin type I repeat-containing protein [Ruminococcus sp.]